MSFYVEGPGVGIEFQVDSMSITENVIADDGILRNPGFESPLSASNWLCNGGCTGSRVSDAHTGNYAYLASSRYVRLTLHCSYIIVIDLILHNSHLFAIA